MPNLVFVSGNELLSPLSAPLLSSDDALYSDTKLTPKIRPILIFASEIDIPCVHKVISNLKVLQLR